MIDAAIHIAPARDLISLDLWEGDLPDLHGTRALQVEPRRWWLVDAGDRIDAIAAAIGDRGAMSAFGGGFVVATIRGQWRDLLSVSALVDTERLAPGSLTSSVIHHVPVRIAVIDETSAEVFFASSYASTLDDLWRGAGAETTTGG